MDWTLFVDGPVSGKQMMRFREVDEQRFSSKTSGRRINHPLQSARNYRRDAQYQRSENQYHGVLRYGREGASLRRTR